MSKENGKETPLFNKHQCSSQTGIVKTFAEEKYPGTPIKEMTVYATNARPADGPLLGYAVRVNEEESIILMPGRGGVSIKKPTTFKKAYDGYFNSDKPYFTNASDVTSVLIDRMFAKGAENAENYFFVVTGQSNCDVRRLRDKFNERVDLLPEDSKHNNLAERVIYAFTPSQY